VIEEPSKNTLFLFVSSHKDKVLSTIMSRVQIVAFSKVKDFEITEYLHKTLPDAELASVHQAVNMADGDINTAISILNNKDEGKFVIGKFRDWLLDCMNYQMRQIITLGDEMSSTPKEKVKVFLSYGFHLIRESLVYQNETSVQRLSEIEKEFVWRFSKFITIENAQEFSDIFQNAIYAIDRNANVKILWGATSLRIGDFLNKHIRK
jgi:DNA polymerase-3 subunit delta'